MYDIEPITSTKELDCGPTCLQMILRYYGEDVDLDTLIKECNIKISGCTGADLKRVGNAHGLDVKAYRMDAEEVVLQDRPSIVHWLFSHWCVCCGLDEDGKVVICNPDKGRYRMSQGSFKAFYSGTALFNGEPGPDLSKTE